MSNAEMLLRLAVAAALGSVIGFERERLLRALAGIPWRWAIMLQVFAGNIC